MNNIKRRMRNANKTQTHKQYQKKKKNGKQHTSIKTHSKEEEE